MRTLHVGLRVADRERSLAFYRALGYEVVGEVPATGIGHLTMLKLPEDPFVTLELVHDPATPVGADSHLSHLVVQVASMADTVSELTGRGLDVAPPTSPDGSADFLTSEVLDPDGNRLELVQWPPGHPDGITGADWPS